MSDATRYIPAHGERRNRLHVGIDVHQPLIADDGGQRMWGARFARLLPRPHVELASTGSLGLSEIQLHHDMCRRSAFLQTAV